MKKYLVYLPGCAHTPAGVPSFSVIGDSIAEPSQIHGRPVMVQPEHFVIKKGEEIVAMVSKLATVVIEEIKP